MADSSERLFKIFSSPDFLALKGLANEVPLFIQTYQPREEDTTRRMAYALESRLKEQGIETVVVDLFTMFLAQLEEEGHLSRIIEREKSLTKVKLIDTLSNLSDPKTRFIPRLVKSIDTPDVKLALLIGVGRLFPFLRTHNILENLQPTMVGHPIVLFFPGEYTQEDGLGSQLRLFGTLTTPLLQRPYYRAFNLEHYRL
ncbi:MAG: DUF1788 domain-containing protein [Fibrobacteres bacterium]|nr:DUF1788 domain-containing protein [Fibrobacterota bacterium]